jgi:integrase
MNDVRVHFRKATLDSLLPKGKRYDAIDTKVVGLHLMIYPSGSKTYNLVRYIRRKKHRIRIGCYNNITIDQARDKAKKLNAAIDLGGNPYADLQAARKELTFRELYEIYYNDHVAKYTKRPEDNRALVEYHILPFMGHWQLSDATKDKMNSLHADIAERRGKPTANKVLNRISSVYNFGINNDKYQGTNPCRGIKRYKEYSKVRFLNREELKAFFNAVLQEEQLFQDYFLMLLLTGARKSTVLAMEYKDVDLNLLRWTIQGQRSKNDEVNVVMLPEQAIEIIRRRYEVNKRLDVPSHYVFPGDGEKGHLCDPKRAWQRIRDRMGVQDITMHDLRRTLGSYMAIRGASLLKIAKALNHKSHRSTAIYARLSQDPIFEAVNEAAEFMNSDSMQSFSTNAASIIKKANGPIKFHSLTA